MDLHHLLSSALPFGSECSKQIVRVVVQYVEGCQFASSSGGHPIAAAAPTVCACSVCGTRRVMAVFKPCGVTVDDAALGVGMLSRPQQCSATVSPWSYVHQIDRHITGVLVGSDQHWVRSELTLQFRKRRVAKTYFALLKGRMFSASDLSDSFRVIDSKLLNEHAVTLVHAVAHLGVNENVEPCQTNRHAVTSSAEPKRYSPKTTTDRTLVLLRPVTGRHHQLRKHMISIGHDIVTFGSKKHKRILLHSSSYRFCPLLYRVDAHTQEPDVTELEWDDKRYVAVRESRGFTLTGSFPDWLLTVMAQQSNGKSTGDMTGVIAELRRHEQLFDAQCNRWCVQSEVKDSPST